MKKMPETEMSPYIRMLRILWAEHLKDKEVLSKIVARKRILTVKRRQLKFLGNVMRKVGAVNLTLACKGNSERQPKPT